MQSFNSSYFSLQCHYYFVAIIGLGVYSSSSDEENDSADEDKDGGSNSDWEPEHVIKVMSYFSCQISV